MGAFYRCISTRTYPNKRFKLNAGNCHSSTQFGQYLIVFGGREGDGKKRIVNDIFIFDTGN